MLQYFKDPLAYNDHVDAFLKSKLYDHGVKTFGYIEIFNDGSFIQFESNQQIHVEILDSELSHKMSEYILSDMPKPNLDLSISNDQPNNCLISQLKGKYSLGHALRFIDSRTDSKTAEKSIRHYYLAAAANDAQVNNFYLNNIDYIRHCFYEFSDKFKKQIDLVSRSYPTSDKLDLTSNLHSNYISKHFTQNNQDKLVFDLNSLPFELDKNALFNVCEKEVIYLYYSRFTLEEIANILEVSVRSINRYIRSIRIKLNCLSSDHIISTLLYRYPKFKS